MKKGNTDLWAGLDKAARRQLGTRDYKSGNLAERMAGAGVEARELVGRPPIAAAAWIPGVEVFARTVHAQRHRGVFGEFARRDEGLLKEIGLWPAQWATARMYANTAKGFHIHPPHIPEGWAAKEWFHDLYIKKAKNFAARPYDREQWDVMFFVQGIVEIFLRDARAGLPGRTMRFFVDGDNHRGANNAGLVVPPGVAHAVRAEGSEDVIMVYGTSTSFKPEFEGRIASEVETAELPPGWKKFLEI